MVDIRKKVGENEVPVKRLKFDLCTCVFCGECVDNCPFGALEMTKDFDLATSQKENLVTDKTLEQ